MVKIIRWEHHLESVVELTHRLGNVMISRVLEENWTWSYVKELMFKEGKP